MQKERYECTEKKLGSAGLCKLLTEWRNSRETLGELRNVTVIQSGSRWFVSIQTRREVEPVLPHGGIVGIDMGIAHFASLSDGSHFDPLNSFKKHQQRLKKY